MSLLNVSQKKGLCIIATLNNSPLKSGIQEDEKANQLSKKNSRKQNYSIGIAFGLHGEDSFLFIATGLS